MQCIELVMLQMTLGYPKVQTTSISTFYVVLCIFVIDSQVECASHSLRTTNRP